MEKRRYIAGAIVDETKDEEMIERMKKEEYQLFRLPAAVNSVYTTFPFSSVFSLFIATKRVPARLAEFLEVENEKAMSVDLSHTSPFDLFRTTN